MFTLKPYQMKTLDALEAYLRAARISDPKSAFLDYVRDNPTDPGNQFYRSRWGLEHVPYVCLRLPTGGGKTCLAAQSVAIAGRSYLEKDYPTVLWLVPTNAIRTQTIEALKRPDHPYREALDNAFDGRVRVFDVSEVEQIRLQDLFESVCIIVGTMATLRVTDTDGRRIYAHNENFESHFTQLPGDLPGLERFDDGKVKFSFVNILHQLEPLVILDEAHKAKTNLSNEVMVRVNPACIIEFTATPIESNILFRVTASELKAEEMIKLPIIVTEHGNWQNAIRETVLTRNGLEQKAGEESDGYIRPIALIQAENIAGRATVDTVKAHLIENEKVDEQSIAIATGSKRDLEGVDIFDIKCPIRYVITVQALKEGWDCPFAYVFCSMANIKSAVDVEQLLGRVLRMPYAKRRTIPELNQAYAHVISPGFAMAAEELEKRLTNMGFQDVEAEENLRPSQPQLPGVTEYPLLQVGSQAPLLFVMESQPDFASLSPDDPSRVLVEQHPEGGYSVRVTGTIDEEFAEKIVNASPSAERDKVRRVVSIHRFANRVERAPSEKGIEFSIPRLCMFVQGYLEPLEKETIFVESGWNLLSYAAEFGSNELFRDEESNTFSFDIKGNKIMVELVGQERRKLLPGLASNWDEQKLVRWLDKQIRQPDIAQPVLLEFIRRCVASLKQKGLDIVALVRAKYTLAPVILQKISRYREQELKHGFQLLLTSKKGIVKTSFDYSFRYHSNIYPAKSYYNGNFSFKKHYYPHIGELASSGEEFRCAQAIDSLPAVKHWVRNIAREEQYSFWLPTSTDKFYPDFVAELNDGRTLVVEYKGEHLRGDDSQEKNNIGKLWEECSDGKGLFLMAWKADEQGRDVFAQLHNAISI